MELNKAHEALKIWGAIPDRQLTPIQRRIVNAARATIAAHQEKAAA